jgi:peroxiredoxin
MTRRAATNWLLALAISAAMCAAGASLASENAMTGKAAPDFTLRSVGGTNQRLKEQRGQVVMLNFWATWCGPCRQEMPQLNRIYQKFSPAGFTLFGVNIDEDAGVAAGMSSRLGLQFPVLLDTDKRVSRMYDLSTMPSTVLIDRDGRVRYVHLGYKEGYEQTYEKQIRELLKE